MSGQVSRGSAGEYQADERAGGAGLSCRVSGVERMRARGYNLGGEQSGHMVLLDHATTGDGLLAALYILRLLAGSTSRLSELRGLVTKFPQAQRNLRVSK